MRPCCHSRVVILNDHHQHGFPILKIAQEMNFQPDTIWVGGDWGDRLPLDDDLSLLQSVPGYLGFAPRRNRNGYYVNYLSRLQNAQRAEGRQPWDELPSYTAEYMVDSIVSIARALSSLPTTLRRSGSNVTSRLQNLIFEGVSGEVSFTEKGDRRDPRYTLFNLQKKNNEEAAWVPVGEVGLDVGSAVLTEGIGSICFASFGCGLDEPPSDKFPVDPPDKEELDVWVPIIISVIAALLLFVTCQYFRTRNKLEKIDNELLDIDKQVEIAKLKQASLILQRSELQEKPDTWSDSTDRLVAVPPEDGQYWTIDARLKSAMPDAHISKLWRVQNKSLWSYYSFHRDRLTRHNTDDFIRSALSGVTPTDDPLCSLCRYSDLFHSIPQPSTPTLMMTIFLF
jgi:type II secretory pathway pseudopilin PulG